LTAVRERLHAYQWAVVAVYALYLLPYVGVSYYERYAVPLLGAKVLLVVWAADRLLPGRTAPTPLPARPAGSPASSRPDGPASPARASCPRSARAAGSRRGPAASSAAPAPTAPCPPGRRCSAGGGPGRCPPR